jgi:hypothetical protein
MEASWAQFYWGASRCAAASSNAALTSSEEAIDIAVIKVVTRRCVRPR